MLCVATVVEIQLVCRPVGEHQRTVVSTRVRACSHNGYGAVRG